MQRFRSGGAGSELSSRQGTTRSKPLAKGFALTIWWSFPRARGAAPSGVADFCLAYAFGRTAVGAVARRSFRNGKWRLIWSSTVQGGGKRRGPRSEYLAQLGSALFLIAAGENASPFAQYHQLVWRVHNRVRARRVEAIVAVEDGLNPPPSPP